MKEPIDFDATLAIAHRFRSELLDVFSEIETWVAGQMGKEKSSTACLGQKLTALSKHTDKAIKKLADDIEQALPLRNAIVHSKLAVLIAQDGERLSLQLSAPDVPNSVVLLKPSELTNYLTKVRSLAKRCAQLSNRPEPAAKAATAVKAAAPAVPAGSSAKASK